MGEATLGVPRLLPVRWGSAGGGAWSPHAAVSVTSAPSADGAPPRFSVLVLIPLVPVVDATSAGARRRDRPGPLYRSRVGRARRAGLRRPQHPAHRDLDDDALRVGPRRPVAQRVAALGLGDGVAVVADDRVALQRRPATAVDLADGRDAAPGGVAGLDRATATDDAGQAGVDVEGDADRHDVRGPVGAQRDQRSEMPLGPE